MKADNGLQIRIADGAPAGFDTLRFYVFWRNPLKDTISVLLPDGQMKVQGPYDPMEPTLEVPGMSSKEFLEQLRDSIDEHLLDKDRLIAEERMNSMEMDLEYIKGTSMLLAEGIRRERKMVDWFKQLVENLLDPRNSEQASIDKDPRKI